MKKILEFARTIDLKLKNCSKSLYVTSYLPICYSKICTKLIFNKTQACKKIAIILIESKLMLKKSR